MKFNKHSTSSKQ